MKNEILVNHFLSEIVEDIEIVYTNTRNDNEVHELQKLYFRKPAECFFLNDLRKENFESNMDISSAETKQRDLFTQVIPLSYVMNKQQHFYQKYGSFYYFTTEEFFKQSHYFLYLMSIVINIILLLSVKFEHIDD